MKSARLGLFVLSAIGLVVSLVIHISLYFDINVQDLPISPFILHIGVFIVFIPSLIFLLIENNDKPDEDGRVNPLKTLYKESPKYLIGIVSILYIYAILNFILFMGTMEGGPSIRDGKYILSNHGNIIRELSFEEYQLYRRREVKGFSGHWMLFYSAALLLSNPFRKKKENLPAKEREIVNRLDLPVQSFERRLYEKGQFLFILSAISIPLFIFFLFYSPYFILLAVTGIFPLNLVLNLYFFVTWSKYYIKFYSIQEQNLQIEVYRYNALCKYNFSLNEIKVKLNKKYIRGGELVHLSFYDLAEKEIFSQYESSQWSPNLLRDLEIALSLAKEKSKFSGL